jgi:hypothetical protein
VDDDRAIVSASLVLAGAVSSRSPPRRPAVTEQVALDESSELSTTY